MIAQAAASGSHTAPRKKPARPHHHKPVRPKCPKPGELGALSAHYESGNRGSAAIGQDKTGGYSYGKYQIETRQGTMKDFLKYAETKAPTMYKKLADAGGYKSALAGEPKFRTAWIGLAADAAFAGLQHDFIASRNYDPLVTKVQSDTGLDVRNRSAALRDVVWSVAVQHGPGAMVISRALAGKSVAGMTDVQIIDAIYDERSGTKTDAHGHKVLKYFSGSTKAVQKDVLARFEHERYCAKEMLATEQKPVPFGPLP